MYTCVVLGILPRLNLVRYVLAGELTTHTRTSGDEVCIYIAWYMYSWPNLNQYLKIFSLMKCNSLAIPMLTSWLICTYSLKWMVHLGLLYIPTVRVVQSVVFWSLHTLISHIGVMFSLWGLKSCANEDPMRSVQIICWNWCTHFGGWRPGWVL